LYEKNAPNLPNLKEKNSEIAMFRKSVLAGGQNIGSRFFKVF
jgi:hypothetical protein